MSIVRKLRVFLSYTHADIVPVRKLYQELNNKDFDVWLDEENLIPGQEWKLEIEKALENSDIVIVCLSNNSVSKEGFVQREFKFALDKAFEMTEDGIFLIPVRLDECKVPSKLSRYHWVDLFVDNGFNRLMKALSLRLSQVTEREILFQQVNLETNTLIPEQDVKEKNYIENLKEITPEIKKEKPAKPLQKIGGNYDEGHSADENMTKGTENELTIDVEQRLVRKNGNIINLSKNQYTLLEKLDRKDGGVCTYAELIKSIYEETLSDKEAANDKRLRNLVDRTKEKIQDQGSDHIYIEVVFGRGYRLNLKA